MKRLLPACSLAFMVSAYAIDFDAKQMVDEHNYWRTKVGSPPLSYSTKLAQSSQHWANYLKQHNNCQMKHSKPKGKYGENLYWGSAQVWSNGRREVQKVTAKQVVDAWASEQADYDYGSNRCKPGKMCGHYTQEVWKSTTTVGCANAVCKDTHEQIWVCQYQPAGNWVGERPY